MYTLEHKVIMHKSQKSQTIQRTNQNSNWVKICQVDAKRGKKVPAIHDWLWFYLLLDEKVARFLLGNRER